MILITAASIEHYLEETEKYRLQLGGTLENEDITSLHYSYDNGSTWSTALTTNPVNLPIVWGGIGVDWWDSWVEIPAAAQADIFPTVESVRDRENPEILFRAVGTTNTVQSPSAITFNLISGVQIKPDSSNTKTDVMLSDTVTTNHDKKFHTSEVVNVIWDTAGGEVDGDLEISVAIDWEGDGLPPQAVNGQTIYWRDGNAVMRLADMNYPDGNSKAYIARIVIKSANPQDPQISLTGEYFCVTKYVAVSDEVPGGDAQMVHPPQSYPQRTELYARTAAEKAIFMDELVTLSQIEAGKGLRLRQRDHEGKKVGVQGEAGVIHRMPDESEAIYNAENPTDYAKAFNVVLEIDPVTLPQPAQPRALQGVVDFNTLSGTVSAVTEADNQYGKLRKYTILHGWNLGDTGDVNYKEYQTANSYHLEFMHVPDTDVMATPFGWSYHDAVPLYATVSRNAIEVFCTVKNANISGLEPTLAKDRVTFAGTSTDPVPSYIFEWRLVEVIPNL